MNNQKKKGTLQQARVENLSNEGRGVARVEGKATFIRGALPEDLVEFEYTSIKKDYDEGRVTQILHSSPYRVEPKCPHYALCGGCSLQHLKEEEQIQFKQKQLFDLLQRFARVQPECSLEPLTADLWHYRNKARLSVRYVNKKQSTLIGFRERNNPRYITEISQCLILNKKVSDDLIPLRTLLDSLEDKQTIAQIEVAAGDAEIALIFRNLSPLLDADAEKIRQFGLSTGYMIFLQPAGPDSVHAFYPPNGSEYLHYSLPQYGLTYEFHPTDFTQINPALNRLMVEKALSLLALEPEDRVLDLFCGLGNFSLPMAQFCAKVIGIEGSGAMVKRAYRNAELNNLGNLEFFAANLDDPAEISKVIQGGFNKVLLDPPRSGALEIVKQIERINPERIVYVSCNPVTLARDTDVLVNQKGYVLRSAGVMDMFPHTAHVESIALFEKG